MTDDSPTLDPRDIATAGEYVLGTMPLGERETFRRRLLDEPALMAEVARWESHFDPIADEVRPVGPPDRVWQDVENRLFTHRPNRRDVGVMSLWRWLAVVSTTALAALLLIVWLNRPGEPVERQLWVSDMVSEDNSVRLTALYDPTDGEMRLSMSGQPASDGRDFELWLIQGDGAPVSLGVMPRDEGHIAMSLPEQLRPIVANATFAITDEPAGGAPGGVATGPVIAQAKMRRI